MSDTEPVNDGSSACVPLRWLKTTLPVGFWLLVCAGAAELVLLATDLEEATAEDARADDIAALEAADELIDDEIADVEFAAGAAGACEPHAVARRSAVPPAARPVARLRNARRDNTMRGRAAPNGE